VEMKDSVNIVES